MNSIEPKPNFNFSYGVLMQLGDKGVALIEQDQTILTPYGVDAAFKTYVTTQTQKLKDFPTDEEMSGKEQTATANKNTTAEVLKTGIRTVMVKVKSVFPEGSPEYNRFGVKGMSEMDDPDLAKCGYRVVRMLNEFLPEFHNIDQPAIDALEVDVKKFDSAYDDLQYASRLHIATTHQRLLVGNDLYAKLVMLFDYGKDHWGSRDISRYKDYVIYNTRSGAPVISGDTASAHGTMIDKISRQPIAGGMISFELVDGPVQVGTDGKWQKTGIPVECKTIFGMAPGHKLFKGTLQLTLGQDTNFDIEMEPAAQTMPS